MFSFFKLYSLYMNNTDFFGSEEACVCEKLPRAVLHVPANHYNVCDLCGMIRRPPTCSSDEEEKMDAERQKILLERRHAEEAAHLNKAARFKVAVKGKKPQGKSYSKRNKSGNGNRTEGGGLGEAGDGDGDGPKEARKSFRRQEEPSAPPPSSPSPAPSGSPCEDTTYIRRRLIYDDPFVKKFIPLKGPITDPSGGAISKRSSNIWGSPNAHISRQQGPLFKDKLQGGCSPGKSMGKYTESQLASQFDPFDEYEGPSEDALIVDSARRMLSRPNSLFIDPRPDLPNNRIGNHGSSLGRIWLPSHSMPSTPTAKIPESPSGPTTNKSQLPEEIKADTKGSFQNSATSSSPIHQLTKSEEHPGVSEFEDILQDLGLIEFSDEKDETAVNELVNEDVFSFNKTMTDEEYSEIESKEWGTPGREPIIRGVRKASEEVEKHKEISKERVCPVSRKNYHFKIANVICSQSIAPRKPVKVAPVNAPVAKNPLKRLFTRKLEILERVQHMCADLPMPQAFYVRQLVGRLSVSFAQKPRALSALDIRKVVPKNWQDSSQNDRHDIESYNRFETREFHSIKQINTKARPVENRPSKAEDHISVIKSLPPKCSKCRRYIKNQEVDSRKFLRDRKQRVCPVHSDTTKRFQCTHRIVNNRSENLETKKVVGKIPVFKMEKTLKTLVVTRKLTTFYKIYHMSVDFPKLHLVSYVRQLSGILQDSFVQNQTVIPRIVDLSTLQFKTKARAVWPSMRLMHKKVPTKVNYDQNISQSDSLEEKRKHSKTRKTMRHNSLKLIEETERERHFQEQNRKRSRSPVQVPDANQDSESERKMILAIVKYFRSIKKPLEKKSRGF